MTLVELAVAMVLLVIAASIYLGALTTVYSGVNRQQRRSEINDEARNAVQQIDREVRSGTFISNAAGNYVYDPATESFAAPTCGGYACVAGYSVRVYSQANFTTRGVGAPVCVQYLVTTDRRLLRRSWVSGSPASSGWQTIATNVVNRDLTPAVPAFAMDGSSGTKVIGVTFLVNNRLGQSDAPRTVRIATSIALRNYGSGDPCTPIPTS